MSILLSESIRVQLRTNQFWSSDKSRRLTLVLDLLLLLCVYHPSVFSWTRQEWTIELDVLPMIHGDFQCKLQSEQRVSLFINMWLFISGWWFQPLWKIWVRQLGWWHSQYMEKINMIQTTNQLFMFPWFSQIIPPINDLLLLVRSSSPERPLLARTAEPKSEGSRHADVV